MNRLYFDYNSTTPVDPRVREVMLPFLGDEYGNPASLHAIGSRARRALDEARGRVASGLGCDPEEIVFTSGGTEGINLAIKGIVLAEESRPAHVVTSEVEHQAVLESLQALEREGLARVSRVPVDGEGRVDLERLEAALQDRPSLVSIMSVNNETGNITSIAALGERVRTSGIVFHTDAVQALGKIPLRLSQLPVDLASFSAHKIYGPKGVGALYVRKGIRLKRVIDGGSQEAGLRSGTENLAGIVGFAAAIGLAVQGLETENRRLHPLRDRLERGILKIPGARVRGSDSRVSNTSFFTFEGVVSEAILIALDREGIAVSSGSACASGTVRPSHVLLAMGVPPGEAKGAVRFSLGRGTTEAAIEFVVEKMPGVVARLRA